jgi:putative ABC transport system ATP-binding protein
MQAPAALLLDEPTGNLDQDSTAPRRGPARRLSAAAAALLWVSHDPRQIERVAQRRFVLEDGRLVDGRSWHERSADKAPDECDRPLGRSTSRSPRC